MKKKNQHYAFHTYRKELLKDKKFKKAFEREMSKLRNIHELIAQFEESVAIAQNAWDRLIEDAEVKEYIKLAKVSRPVGWDGK